SFGMRRKRPRSEWLLQGKYRNTAALARAPTGTRYDAVIDIPLKRTTTSVGSPVIQSRQRFVSQGLGQMEAEVRS
ncbi:MAG TPA: hypothetical protein VGC82_14065, partial [Rhodopila sp.]